MRVDVADVKPPELPVTARAAFELMRDNRQPWFTRVKAAQDLSDALRKFEPKLAAAARANGHTWEEIGYALGITRQAAQQRFGSLRGSK